MLPTLLNATDPEEERRRYQIVRLWDCRAFEPTALILSASTEAGICMLRLANGASQEFNFGPNGFRIVAR